MDAYDLLDVVDIGGQIPANFYTQMESKKWSERKEALEIIEKATAVPKIQNSDFSELVRVLKKTVAKDSNIVVSTLAAKCLCQLAQGLRHGFSPYASSCLAILFEKFKEKKPNVNTVMREAADAAFAATNLEETFETIIQFLDNKNPQIRAEMAHFLSRVFSHFSHLVLNKKTLRPLINALIKTLSDMDATVRENSALAIGTAMKVAGEKLMMTLIADVEPIKIAKIKEFCEKAEIVVPQTNGLTVNAPEVTNGNENLPTAPTNGLASDEGGDDDDEERMFDMLEAVDVASQVPGSFYTQIESKKWSERKDALEIIERITSVPKIQNSDFSELVRVLKKTISKDSNIVVATLAAKCLCQLATGLRRDFAPHSSSSLSILFEKFKEKKPNVISVMRDTADAAFVGTNIECMMEDIVLFLDNKNPQIRAEMELFLARAFAKFPAQVMNKKTLRPLINALIKTLSDMDATVRDNSAMAIGTAMKVTGEKLMMTLIADVEAIKLPKIKEFCEKAQVKKVSQAQMNAIRSSNAPPQQQPTQPSYNNSSATMVRSTSSKRIPGKPGVLRPPTITSGTGANSTSASVNNATVKRTATIIKRSTVTGRRVSALPSSHSASHPASAAQLPTVQQQSLVQQPVTVPQPPAQNLNNTITKSQQQPAFLTSTPIKPVFASVSKPSGQDHLDLLLFRLLSDRSDEIQQSIAELSENLEDSENAFKGRINQLIDLSSLQFVKIHDQYRQTNSQSNNIGNGLQSNTASNINDLTNLLMQLFKQKQLVSMASHQSLRFLLTQIFTLVEALKVMNHQHDYNDSNHELFVKNLNNLASTILDAFEPASNMAILGVLLNEPSRESIVESIKTAVIRSMRS